MRFAWNSQKYLPNLNRKIVSALGTLNHHLSTLGTWTMLSNWAILALECCFPLKHPLFLSIFIKNQFSLIKKVLFLFIPLGSLICYKPNIFRHTYDFPIGRTTTLDLQWRVSHYLKRLLRLNIKMSKIVNIYHFHICIFIK